MENRIDDPRNPLRADFARLPERSPSKNTECRARKPGWGTPKNPNRAPGIESAPVVAKRARRQQVEIAIGTGHPEMSPEHIARGLGRISRKGVRTSIVREWAGFPAVLSPDIPTGTVAMRTADRITAYSLETALPVVTLSCIE